MSERVTLEDLRRLEAAAREEIDRAVLQERALLRVSDDATDEIERRAALALSQAQGCHKRHWKRIADAYAIALRDLED